MNVVSLVIQLNSREEFLENHKKDCKGIGKTAVRIEMPEDGKNIIRFKNFYKQQKSPFVIYANFESLTKKIEEAEMDPNKSNTINTQLHEACSYCYIVVRSDGKTNKPVEYRGPNAAEHMLKSLMKERDKILETLANPKPMKMTKKDITNFENAIAIFVKNLS